MRPERFATLKRVLDRRQPDLTVLMDNVHKSHNLAAVLRTCDAVGVLAVHAVSPQGEVQKHHMRAGGSSRWMPVHVHPDVATACTVLKAQGFTILAAHLSPRARDYREFDYTRPTAIVLGAELYGVSEDAARLADAHACIPLHGHVASLNVSVAAGVILYEAERQRALAGLYDAPRLDPATYERLLFEWAYPRIAAACRRQGRPYPLLDAEGFLLRSD